MATRKAQKTKRPRVKVGKVQKTSATLKTKDLKKVRGGTAQLLGYDYAKNVKV